METWLSRVAELTPVDAATVCEINTRDAHASAVLLGHLKHARLFGLAIADSDAARAELRTRLTQAPSLRNRTTIFFGDKMRTVRAAPALDNCNVMVINGHPSGSGEELGALGMSMKKLVGDLPNVLQRMAPGRARGTLVMHGPPCTRGSRNAPGRDSDWCDGWSELVSRRLVTPSGGCISVAQTPGAAGRSSSWCVGRVATDSACTARPPLLPALPIRGAREPRQQAAFVAPTSTMPSTRSTAAYEAEGWRSEEVGGLRLGYWWRYFTLWQGCDGPSRMPIDANTVPTSISNDGGDGGTPESNVTTSVGTSEGPSNVCLLFKNHVFESWVGGVGSSDYGRTFESVPSLVLPATWAVARMTHNLAITRAGGQYVFVGGQFKLKGAARCGRRSGNTVPCRPGLPEYNGLWMARASSWRFMGPQWPQISTRLNTEELARRSELARLAGWSSLSRARSSWMFNGTHDGCIEKRSRFYASMAHLGTCEFDGRLSLVHLGSELRLYARANPAVHGQRFVQTVASRDGGQTWGRFEFVRLAEYEYAHGDVYFFAVSVNPVDPNSLVALFPLAHKFHGCIALAASIDGVHWSAPTPLLRCAVHGERAVHHPAQGFVMEGDDRVVLYVHENVPGVTSDLTPSSAQMQQFPYLRLPRPRLVRHTLPVAALRRWTEAALATLKR